MDVTNEVIVLAHRDDYFGLLQYTVEQLAYVCDRLGISRSGTKDDLVQRILAVYSPNQRPFYLKVRNKYEPLIVPGYSDVGGRIAGEGIPVTVIYTIIQGQYFQTAVYPNPTDRDLGVFARDYTSWLHSDGAIALERQPCIGGKAELRRQDRNGKTYHVIFYNLSDQTCRYINSN